jgi:hypothetical protein
MTLNGCFGDFVRGFAMRRPAQQWDRCRGEHRVNLFERAGSDRVKVDLHAKPRARSIGGLQPAFGKAKSYHN